MMYSQGKYIPFPFIEALLAKIRRQSELDARPTPKDIFVDNYYVENNIRANFGEAKYQCEELGGLLDFGPSAIIFGAQKNTAYWTGGEFRFNSKGVYCKSIAFFEQSSEVSFNNCDLKQHFICRKDFSRFLNSILA